MTSPRGPEPQAEHAPGGPALLAGAHSHSAAQGPVPAGALLGGRYEVGERIGSGGMATIYRAFDRTLERPVAVKVLHAHLADDPDLHERFRTEARHAAFLSHPHIVTVFDQGIAELPYIVMELVDGPSLREVLTDHGQLSAAEALTLIEAVAAALARAHRAGVVHRDIKPENVLVTAEGTPKVADFGIARVMAGTSHTQTGALIGSVHYMAPELVDGHDATAASDQYAIGVLLYELLTGQRPYAGDTPMAVALRHTRDRVPAPSLHGADCGAAVDAVVRRATEHDPDARYPDLAAFAEALGNSVPEGPTEVAVSDAASGHTLVIPAEARDTISLAVQTELAARRSVAPASPAPAGGLRPGDAGSTPTVHPAHDERGVPEKARRPRLLLPSRTPRGRGRTVPPADDAPASNRRRVRRVALVSVLSVLLLVATAGGTWAWWNYLVAPVTTVPPLVGLSEEEAFATADDLGLGFAVGDERYDFDAPEGQVLEQDPPEGTELRRGDDLTVVLSRGRQPVDMPAVVGDEEADAVAELEAERLEVTVERSHHDDAPAGQVIGQDPDEATPLRQGDSVTITVSLGIEQVDVPQLAGRSVGELESLLADANLGLGAVTRVWSDQVPTEGEVIDQDHDPGSTVDKGTTVDVTVSLGPRTIQVPDLRGEPVAEAQAALEARSLAVDVIVEPRPRLGPFVRGSVGQVEEQLPGGGEAITRGETVTLYTFGE
jgi:eukaryotic-like serine/threonine-protein kinase